MTVGLLLASASAQGQATMSGDVELGRAEAGNGEAPDQRSRYEPSVERAALLDSLQATRARFTRYGALSKRGMASVTMSLQVLDALVAPSLAESRSRLRSLPITVLRRTPTADGQQVVVEYRINGRQKSRTFGASLVGSANGSGAMWAANTHVRMQGKWLVLAPSATCTYTDPDNVVWSGTCATQQEIDDATLQMIALQEEGDDIVAETNADWAAACAARPGMCEEPTDDADVAVGSAASFTLTAMSASEAQSDSADFSSLANWGDVNVGLGAGAATTCAAPADAVGNAIVSCYANGIAYAGSVAGFGLRIARLSAVLAAAAPPAGAVGEALGWAIVTAGAVAGTAIALHECLM